MDAKERKLLRYLVLAFLGLTLGIGWLAEFIMDSYPLSPYRIGLRIVCILADLLLLARILHLLLVRSQISPRRKNLTVAGGGFLFIVLVLEIPFMFIPYSHGNGNTYGSRIWFNTYWQQNSLGYRDREPSVAGDSGKVKLFFLGDSFTAGHGIKNPSDRYSDLVAAELGERFSVYNLGVCGASSKDELKNLREFPQKPDILILSHVINDIDDASASPPNAHLKALPSGKPNELEINYAGIKLLEFLGQGSFTINYAFWKFHGFLESKEEPPFQNKPEDFGNSAPRLYFEEGRLPAHHSDLQMIIDECRASGTKLLVLTFPVLFEGGIEFTQREINLPLGEWFAAQNVSVLHGYAALKAIPEADRIVNYNDKHPSEAAHRAIADLVMAELRKLGWIN